MRAIINDLFKNSKNPHAKKITVSLVGLAVIALTAFGLWRSSVTTFAGLSSVGKIQVEVLDGRTDSPLSGAKVVIPELGKSYSTNSRGKTQVIALPYQEKESDPVKQSWNEITVLVYAQGYIPYALFNAQVFEGQLRAGPKIYLFPMDAEEDFQPFSVTEGPPREYVNELIKQYTPE